VVQSPPESHIVFCDSTLDGERTLARRRQHQLEVQQLPALVHQAETLQTGAGKDDTVVRPSLVQCFPQARVYVPANIEDANAWIVMEELRGPAAAAGPDRGACRQLVEPETGSCNQSVSRMSALEDGADAETGSALGWEVFQAVDGDVNAAVHQCGFQLGCECAFAAQLRQRRVQDTIAASRKHNRFGL
jgi:hypothetical protein